MATKGHPYDWIEKATAKNKGALRKKTDTPAGKDISARKLEKAEKSKSPTEQREANLAATLKKMPK